jgi:serine/threonine protein kinase
MTQMRLAETLRCSERWIELLEAGVPADKLYVQDIAQLFDVPVESLIRESPTGDGVLGQEWNVDRKVRKEKSRVAANGLRYEVFRLPSRHLASRFARAKLYDTTSLTAESEERITALLSRHPLICHRLRDVPFLAKHITTAADERNGYWWVLDEWVDGEKLTNVLNQSPTHSRLRELGLQLLEALAKLHAHDVIRRELTPKSVIVPMGNANIVLTDFETGKLLEGVPTVSPKDRWRHAEYLAPEVVAGADVDFRSDWYSWGLIMIHGICGRLPRSHADQLKALTPLPTPIQVLLTSCISPAPSDRPASAKKMIRELKKWKD